MKQRTLRALFIASLMVLPTLGISAQETGDTQERNSGPRQIVITYRCTPSKRVAFRRYMEKTGIAKFDDWKKSGLLESYRLIFNRYVDADTWDMMSVLTFARYSDVAKWGDVEKNFPGGLAAEGLTLATPLNTYSLDLIWHAASEPPQVRGKAVFFVIPYDYYPHTIEEYIKYVNTYVMPQINGWMKEGIMAGYGIYLNRYPTSRPWKSLFILEYKDADAFGTREKTMAKVRADLKATPEWKALSDVKQTIRIEKETVVGEELLPSH